VKDYFEDYAFYCEPGDLNSIKKAIDNAWNSDVNNELKNKILQQYTWTQTAQLTYEAYKSVLKNFPKKTKDTK
jgi:thioredoxin-like negative regulator of GroEL